MKPGSRKRVSGRSVARRNREGTNTPERSIDTGAANEGEMRIARWLSRAGAASRRQSEALVLEGRVRVNGRICTSPATRVDPADRVDLDGRRLRRAQPSRLWMYCKPVGVIVSRTDPQGRRSLNDALPTQLAGVMPVGRLDVASEGLLLLTNDGALKRYLELPASRIVRVYRARVRGLPDDSALRAFREGLTIGSERFRPMGVAIERRGGSNTWLRLELSEGRYREVRRAFAHVGHPVNRLRRIAYGPVRLGGLKPGETREVPPRVVRRIVNGMVVGERLQKARQ